MASTAPSAEVKQLTGFVYKDLSTKRCLFYTPGRPLILWLEAPEEVLDKKVTLSVELSGDNSGTPVVRRIDRVWSDETIGFVADVGVRFSCHCLENTLGVAWGTGKKTRLTVVLPKGTHYPAARTVKLQPAAIGFLKKQLASGTGCIEVFEGEEELAYDNRWLMSVPLPDGVTCDELGAGVWVTFVKENTKAEVLTSLRVASKESAAPHVVALDQEIAVPDHIVLDFYLKLRKKRKPFAAKERPTIAAHLAEVPKGQPPRILKLDLLAAEAPHKASSTKVSDALRAGCIEIDTSSLTVRNEEDNAAELNGVAAAKTLMDLAPMGGLLLLGLVVKIESDGQIVAALDEGPQLAVHTRVLSRSHAMVVSSSKGLLTGPARGAYHNLMRSVVFDLKYSGGFDDDVTGGTPIDQYCRRVSQIMSPFSRSSDDTPTGSEETVRSWAISKLVAAVEELFGDLRRRSIRELFDFIYPSSGTPPAVGFKRLDHWPAVSKAIWKPDDSKDVPLMARHEEFAKLLTDPERAYEAAVAARDAHCEAVKQSACLGKFVEGSVNDMLKLPPKKGDKPDLERFNDPAFAGDFDVLTIHGGEHTITHNDAKVLMSLLYGLRNVISHGKDTETRANGALKNMEGRIREMDCIYPDGREKGKRRKEVEEVRLASWALSLDKRLEYEKHGIKLGKQDLLFCESLLAGIAAHADALSSKIVATKMQELMDRGIVVPA